MTVDVTIKNQDLHQDAIKTNDTIRPFEQTYSLRDSIASSITNPNVSHAQMLSLHARSLQISKSVIATSHCPYGQYETIHVIDNDSTTMDCNVCLASYVFYVVCANVFVCAC